MDQYWDQALLEGIVFRSNTTRKVQDRIVLSGFSTSKGWHSQGIVLGRISTQKRVLYRKSMGERLYLRGTQHIRVFR